MLELRSSYTGRNLVGGRGICCDALVQGLDLIAVGKGPPAARRKRNGLWSLICARAMLVRSKPAAVKRHASGPGAAHFCAKPMQSAHDLLGQEPMRGELAAIDSDETARTICDRSKNGTSADAARPFSRIIVERPHPRPAVDDIGLGGRPARVGEIAVIRIEQIRLFFGRAFGITRIALMRHIGRADDQETGTKPGNDENDALFLVLQRIGVSLRGLRHTEGDVTSAYEPQGMGRGRGSGQPIDISDPWSGRIDDEARLDAALTA